MADISYFNFKEVRYRIIGNAEFTNGKAVQTYGIEGEFEGELITLSGLSEDVDRVRALVDKMNLVGFDFKKFKRLVAEFLNDNYGVVAF